jgi:uncharacterized membrane protein YedE/YeeE
MPITDPLLLASVVLFLGAILGVALFRGDYCMVAMLRDFFLIRDTTLLRSYAVYFVIASALFHFGGLAGLIPFLPPPTLQPPSLPTLAGGFLFGIGMVLAGGCVVGTLYKMAAGNLINWIGFGGILAGSLLYAEVHPWIRGIAEKTTFIGALIVGQGHPLAHILLLAILLAGGGIMIGRWLRRGELTVTAYAKGYLQPWRVAVILALVNFCYYALAGSPMGVTTAFAKIAAHLEQLVLPGHVAALSYFQEDSVAFRVEGILLSGGAGPRFDYISVTELALTAGIFLGALAAALHYREFRIYGLPPWRQGGAAFLGGMLLAFGARLASGCNVKFFLGALPLLSWQGIFFAGSTLVGVALGTKILIRCIVR